MAKLVIPIVSGVASPSPFTPLTSKKSTFFSRTFVCTKIASELSDAEKLGNCQHDA